MNPERTASHTTRARVRRRDLERTLAALAPGRLTITVGPGLRVGAVQVPVLDGSAEMGRTYTFRTGAALLLSKIGERVFTEDVVVAADGRHAWVQEPDAEEFERGYFAAAGLPDQRKLTPSTLVTRLREQARVGVAERSGRIDRDQADVDAAWIAVLDALEGETPRSERDARRANPLRLIEEAQAWLDAHPARTAEQLLITDLADAVRGFTLLGLRAAGDAFEDAVRVEAAIQARRPMDPGEWARQNTLVGRYRVVLREKLAAAEDMQRARLLRDTVKRGGE